MNEVGLDPGIDHMLAMQCFDEIRQLGGKVCALYHLPVEEGLCPLPPPCRKSKQEKQQQPAGVVGLAIPLAGVVGLASPLAVVVGLVSSLWLWVWPSCWLGLWVWPSSCSCGSGHPAGWGCGSGQPAVVVGMGSTF